MLYSNFYILKKDNLRNNFPKQSKGEKLIYMSNKNYYKIFNKIQNNSNHIIKNCTIFIEHFIIRNKYNNLVSKQTTYIIYRKHFLDSLTLFSIIRSFCPKSKQKFCLDVGTGSGFPGFVLTMMFPSFFFCLVDSI